MRVKTRSQSAPRRGTIKTILKMSLAIIGMLAAVALILAMCLHSFTRNEDTRVNIMASTRTINVAMPQANNKAKPLESDGSVKRINTRASTKM